MPKKLRIVLINPSGRALLKRLTEEYPEYRWVLALKDDREVCMGLIDNKPTVVGPDYDTIKDNLIL